MSVIQWYPGHIAKAEQHLRQQLQRVDVVLEVIDARIPLASRHPHVSHWIGSKPRLLVFNKIDCIPDELIKAWSVWFAEQGIPIYPTNGQSGQGVQRLKQATLALGSHVNQRRQSRGMQPRPVRAVVIGFPNVGKSALLNRLIGQRVVASAAKPGVTKQLHWVRLGAALDLLDAPGVIPPRLDDQGVAVKLAICDDIGSAAYTPELIAAELLELLLHHHPQGEAALNNRYGEFDPQARGSEMLVALAEQKVQGNENRMAQQILQDFRKGNLGRLALECPPPGLLDPSHPKDHH
ncbi:MAG: ribosome biogenesis GTPase YlqF [Cyanobacteriota bacterium]|nr:ribosome biogenesis GTPase YlqF [Cyanobacteriota bacterium]